MYTKISCDFKPTHVMVINPDNDVLIWDEDFGNQYYFQGFYPFAEQPNTYGMKYLKVTDYDVYIGRYNTGVTQSWTYYIYK